MIHALTLLLSVTGFGLLLLAMARHQQDWLRRKLDCGQSRLLRSFGAGCLVLALAGAAHHFGWARGILVALGWMTMGAALVVTVNTNRAKIMGRGD